MDRFDLMRSLVNQKFGEVRVLIEDNGVLFCGTDVARALEYTNPRKAIRDHCPRGTKRSVGVQTGVKSDGTPALQTIDMTFIPEGDVYRLIVRSKMESAEEFEHWLFDEMLPTVVESAKALESIEYCGEIEGLVYTKNGVPMTTSAMISKKFKKNHKDILRMIDNKMASIDENVAQFCAAHIREAQYIAEDGQAHRQYELDKQGFSFIALSMTGVQADVFKIQYINAFAKMEEKIAEMYKARVLESVLPQNNSNRQFVYIIKNPLNDTVKIGVAQDVQKRLQQLQTGAGVELELLYQSVVCSNAYSIESDVHSHFADYRTFGEWYKVPVDEAIDYLEQQRFVLRSEYANRVSMLANFGMDDAD